MPPSEVEKLFRAFAEKRKAELSRFIPDGIPITLENKFDDAIYNYLYAYWKEHSGQYDPKGNVVASNTANHLSLEYKTENELKFAQWAMREYGMTNKERTTHTFKGQMSVLLEVWNVVDMITLPISLVSAGGKFIGKEVAKEVAEELGEKAVKEVAEEAVEKTVKTEVSEEIAESAAKKEMADAAEDLTEKIVKKEEALEDSSRVKGGSGAAKVGIDTIKDNLVNKVKDIRRQMPNTNLAKRGNMAVADVDIPGVKDNFVAHSKINAKLDKGADVAEFSYLKPENERIFTTYVNDRYPRYHDTEAKILEDIASQITDPNVSGIINLYSELSCCQSCSNIILEFRRMFPNIKLNIFVE